MSLIATLNEPISKENIESTDYNVKKHSRELILKVIEEYPNLIVDSKENNIQKDVLIQEIRKMIDKSIFSKERESIINEILDYIFGYGPLQNYISDPDVSDIDGSRFDYFTVKKNGIKEKIDFEFDSEAEFLNFVKMIVIRNGGVINNSVNHCRVSDEVNKLRINVSIKPRNTTGTSLSIRKHREHAYNYLELLKLNMLDEDSMEIMKSLNRKGVNVLVCGRGGAGKTTLLRSLIDDMNSLDRVLVCETESEIYPQKKNVIGQKIIKSKKQENKVDLSNLIANGLTMSLDTYVVGEIIEGAWEFLVAGNTGTRVIATLHSNSAENAIGRMLALVEKKNNVTESGKKLLISEAVDIIIHIECFRVKKILQIKGYDENDNKFELEVLYNCRH